MAASASAQAFTVVLGKPGGSTDLSRRLSAAQRAAEEAQARTRKALVDTAAATQRAQVAEEQERRVSEQCEHEQEAAGKARLVAADARREAHTAQCHLREALSRLAHYEPLPAWPRPGPGQMGLADSEGVFGDTGSVLIEFLTVNGNPKNMVLPSELAELLYAVEDAAKQPLRRSRAREQWHANLETATMAFRIAAAGAGISKTRTERLLVAAASTKPLTS